MAPIVGERELSGISQGAFCVKFTPKIHDCTPTFIINYIMIFETPRRTGLQMHPGVYLIQLVTHLYHHALYVVTINITKTGNLSIAITQLL